ncbi:MAG TPA: LuxR C-terminal-related transcriptional regulator [Pseudonocardiaceae bacterium]|nr:LuxR C-terminal-related transcriptional regulator [Pseudonocardiaceae bacterium]
MPRGKIAAPVPPATFVPRPVARHALDRATGLPVTLVCAPAGFGKTVLLADWVTSVAAPVAWVRVDADDEDAEVFWSAVLSALCGCAAVPVDSPLRDLAPPPVPGADFLADVVDALDTLPVPVVLVLDDLHTIDDGPTMRGIATLIRHRPGGLRLVLATRSDPPLPLARLHPQGGLVEVRADVLRFSPADADLLLRSADVALTQDQLHRLVELTDGWAGGLRLAVRPLRDTPDPNALLADIANGAKPVGDYLADEVLARLAPDAREFLDAICVCDELTPELAESLSGRADAGMVLDALAWDSSLVIGTGAEPGHYRVHPVLRAYLLARLGPSAYLHAAASAWFAAHDRPDAAVEHARLTGNVATLVELVRRYGITLLLQGDHRIVRRGLTGAGPEVVAADPLLAAISAFALLQEGDVPAAEAGLVDVAGPVAALVRWACVVAWGAPLPAGSRAALRAAARDADPGLAAWARSVLGRALLHAGDSDAARVELVAAHEAAVAGGFDYLATHCLAALATVRALSGDYTGMAAASATAVSSARDQGVLDSPLLAAGHAMLGFASAFRFDPVAAAQHAARAAESVSHLPAQRFAAGLLDGIARFDVGDRPAGAQLLLLARRRLGDAPVPPQLIAVAALVEHQAAALLRQHSVAREVTTWARARIGLTGELALLGAWTALARADTELARELLADAPPALVPLTGVESRLVEAAMAIGSDERTRARRALADALGLAEPDGLVRPFAYADPAVRQLLVDQIGGFGPAEAFAAHVHATLSARRTGRDADRLTGQEQVVLTRLAAQRSLDEIADDLAVSVNTVKTHVRAIYAKLGVNNRRSAVVAARERGLT